MKKVSKLLHFILAPSLLIGLSFLVWACGPAAPAVDEPTPAHALQPTAIPTAEPGPFTDPGVPPAAVPDESLQEPISVVDGHTLPGAEPVTSLKPAAGEPLRTFSGQQVKIGTVGSDPALVSGQQQSAQYQPYTWHDGDRTLTVLLQSDLTVTQDGDVAPRENVAPGSEAAGPRGKATSDSGQAQPVFRSQSGTLMTLPGGVLLALDETWEQPAVDAFFAYNGINLDRVSELDYLTNGFFVETEPGFPSLELANALAEQDGVRVSSPNWWRDRVAK